MWEAVCHGLTWLGAFLQDEAHSKLATELFDTWRIPPSERLTQTAQFSVVMKTINRLMFEARDDGETPPVGSPVVRSPVGSPILSPGGSPKYLSPRGELRRTSFSDASAVVQQDLVVNDE